MSLTDGPYARNLDGKWEFYNYILKNGNVSIEEAQPQLTGVFLEEILKRPPSTDIITQDTIACIGDIHGAANQLKKLCRKAGIVDEHDKWIFGNRYLVCIGDVVNKGPHVTEALWFLANLTIQARKKHGEVIILKGNHEISLMLGSDYGVHTKYLKHYQEGLRCYINEFDENHFFGKWIRSWPVVVKIGVNLFVHAGLSKSWAQKSLAEINQRFQNPAALKLMDPMVYRGYLESRDGYNKVSEKELNQILEQHNVSRVIIGHTQQPTITGYFGNKIINTHRPFSWEDEPNLEQQGELLMIDQSGVLKVLNYEGKIRRL